MKPTTKPASKAKTTPKSEPVPTEEVKEVEETLSQESPKEEVTQKPAVWAPILSDEEYALICLMRSVGDGHIEALDIRNGVPYACKAGLQVLNFLSEAHRERMVKGKAVAVDMTPGNNP